MLGGRQYIWTCLCACGLMAVTATFVIDNHKLQRTADELHAMFRYWNTPDYVRIPKTGSTSVIEYLRSCKTNPIPMDPRMREGSPYPHVHAPSFRSSWAVIRPVEDRLASFLNFRWKEYDNRGLLRPDFPSKLNFPPLDGEISTLLDSLSDGDLLNFRPFQTMTEYIRPGSTKILCSLTEVPAYAETIGFKNCSGFPKRNVSPRAHGNMSETQKRRVRRVFGKDQKLWNRHCLGHDEY